MKTTSIKQRSVSSSNRPTAPSTVWREAVLRLFRRRKQHLQHGERLLNKGRLNTLRLSPNHIQGFIYTRDSRFVLVNIHLSNVMPDTLNTPDMMKFTIECSEKHHPGLSRYAAATLLAVGRRLRYDHHFTSQLLNTAAADQSISES